MSPAGYRSRSREAACSTVTPPPTPVPGPARRCPATSLATAAGHDKNAREQTGRNNGGEVVRFRAPPRGRRAHAMMGPPTPYRPFEPARESPGASLSRRSHRAPKEQVLP
ncbi:hypothetical protein GCM10009802_23610 [Streptomyces synnematoformans]|uniref:Uncharacterized protein n=1 Tax=Streptomyces synnematoformans TaxID=415721 RepID=A0ABP5JUM9_9ACTN